MRIRKILRNTYDSLYCKNIKEKIVIGSKGDSWVIVENIALNIVYSGGVGKDIHFELEMIEKYNSKVFAYDPSPTGLLTIKSIVDKPENLFFFPIGLSKMNEILTFNYPKNIEEGSFSINSAKENHTSALIEFECESISYLMKKNGHNRIDVLKIDIEGAEYGVIEDIIENNLDITQICVEFHHFFPTVSRRETYNAIQSLKKAGYTLAHKVGPNYSFIKK